MRDLIILIVFGVIYFLSWVVVHIVCTHKYLICNGNCKRCKNWKCKQYAFRPVIKEDEYGYKIDCCRVCGCSLSWNLNEYCHNCGHKVDWSQKD